MRQQVLLDTGPLVALIDRRDRYHSWVKTELATIQPPLLSCEAILSEAWFLLQRVSNGRETLVGLLTSGQILIAFQLNEEEDSRKAPIAAAVPKQTVHTFARIWFIVS